MASMNRLKSIGGWGAAFGLLLSGLVLTGCQMFSSDPEFGAVAAKTGSAGGSTGAPASTNGGSLDTINIGDSLTIVFSDLVVSLQPFEVRVNENGTITLIENQTFTAAGKTRAQLEKEIRDRYVPAFYVKMTVTIKPQERSFWVGGEVRQPGRMLYPGPITLLKAIQSAGDFTDFAQKKRVKLRHLDGKTETINCINILGGKPDVQVYPGDTIHVPRRIF